MAVGEVLANLQDIPRTYARELLIVTAEGLGIF